MRRCVPVYILFAYSVVFWSSPDAVVPLVMFLPISVCGEFSLSIVSGATALGLAGVILASISILKVKSIMIAVSSVLLAISAMLFVLSSSHKVFGVVSASPLILGVLFVLCVLNKAPLTSRPSQLASLVVHLHVSQMDEHPKSAKEQAAGREWFNRYCDKLDHSSVVRPKAGSKYACPCCGYRTLSERGSFEICQVCYWEDDGQDDHDADEVRGGPNGALSLAAARMNFGLCQASDPKFVSSVRPPVDEEKRG